MLFCIFPCPLSPARLQGRSLCEHTAKSGAKVWYTARFCAILDKNQHSRAAPGTKGATHENTTEENARPSPTASAGCCWRASAYFAGLWIFWLALKLNDYSTAIQVCTSVLTFLITLRIYGLHINSAYKISWIILILLFPIFGLTIYLLFGRSGAVSVMRRRFGKNMTMLRQYHAPILQQRRALPYPDRITRNHARYLQDRAGYPAYDNTDVTFYGDTCEALEAQKTALRSAEKFIFMEYHAIEDASAWQELEDILAERAAHGVEVRVFYDDVAASGLSTANLSKSWRGAASSAAGSTRSSRF